MRSGGGEGGSKSRTSLIIVFSVLFFTIMLRNHSYLPHRYSIRFALLLMTLDTRVHAGGGARGQNLGCLIFFYFFFFLRMTF